jgi:hypothetical protein
MTFMPLIASANPYPVTGDPNVFAGRGRGSFIDYFHRPFTDYRMDRTGRDESDPNKDR